MTTAAPRPGTGRDDWLDEGLRLVASLGAPALTLDRICERMALTKGAFYHHFGSVPKFRIALLDWYEQACITVGALLIAAAYGVLAVAGTAQRFGPEGMYRLGVWALAALLLHEAWRARCSAGAGTGSSGSGTWPPIRRCAWLWGRRPSSRSGERSEVQCLS